MSETGLTPPSPGHVSAPAVPRAGAANSDSEPRRTAPLSILIGMVSGLSNAILPAIFAGYSIGEGSSSVLIALGVGVAIAAIGAFFSYIGWKRLTYSVGEQDIRVESGVLSRAARSVPYERIQDVSLEQKLLARIFGLVAVKFETGAGGGDDLSLSYLTEDEGERLRQLVRQRRDGQAAAVSEAAGANATDAAEPEPEALFTMNTRRLVIFGLFEFSLAVFAVLAGLTQYLDGFIEIGDAIDLVTGWVSERGEEVAGLGATLQLMGALAGLIGVFVVGSATGLIRTFLREWGFLLERTERGFRRRRGLLTKTDVVMPVHRVQGIRIGTGLLRYRFGWHDLRFVSLAQDAGSSSHVVAPFAKVGEIAPIAASAGFQLPDDSADWHRASKHYRDDSALFASLFYVVIAIVTYFATAAFTPEWATLAAAIPVGFAIISGAASLYAWTFHRHALDDAQIMATRGFLSPQSQIATRMKLHSVEIAQGPIARWRGYATLHLGLAGGEFEIPGVPIQRAREVRREVLATIAATDFSQLEQA